MHARISGARLSRWPMLEWAISRSNGAYVVRLYLHKVYTALKSYAHDMQRITWAPRGALHNLIVSGI